MSSAGGSPRAAPRSDAVTYHAYSSVSQTVKAQDNSVSEANTSHCGEQRIAQLQGEPE
jgi:hypothetical protein